MDFFGQSFMCYEMSVNRQNKINSTMFMEWGTLTLLSICEEISLLKLFPRLIWQRSQGIETL